MSSIYQSHHVASFSVNDPLVIDPSLETVSVVFWAASLKPPMRTRLLFRLQPLASYLSAERVRGSVTQRDPLHWRQLLRVDAPNPPPAQSVFPDCM